MEKAKEFIPYLEAGDVLVLIEYDNGNADAVTPGTAAGLVSDGVIEPVCYMVNGVERPCLPVAKKIYDYRFADADFLLRDEIEDCYEEAWGDVPKEAIAALDNALANFYAAIEHIYFCDADPVKMIVF